MAAPVYLDLAGRERPVAPDRAAVLRTLAATEARRNLRAPWLWVGITTSALFALTTLDASYANGGYQGVMASFAGVVAAVFVLAVGAGSRDRTTTSDAPLAEESVLDADDRALARLLGLLPALGVGALYVLAVFALARGEGGFWVGDAPGRTDTAQHGLFEVLQPVALLLLAAASGVAIGRATSQRALTAVIGVVVLSVAGFVYWAWQAHPVNLVSLIQTQPFEVPVEWPGGEVDFTAVPDSWLLSAPDAYEPRWRHLVLDQSVAAAHDAYLLGLAAVAGGFAVRGRGGRWLTAGGAAVALAGVGVQFLVYPVA